MKRTIMRKGLLGLALLGFLLFSFSQDASANVTLKVNAGTNVATANINKLTYYKDAISGKTSTLSLPWKEKVMYTNAANVAVTVKNALAGDLIVKADIFASTTSGAIKVYSGKTVWFVQDEETNTAFNSKFTTVVMVGNDSKYTKPGDTSQTTVDSENLSTLVLGTFDTKNTTTLLLNFSSGSETIPAYIVLTAILVDDAGNANPQVMGVDTQTIFFNGAAGTTPETTQGIWLNLIKTDATYTPPQ